ncbi:MAG: translesion DNA synthesis-associated protein ImuA [Candidatus Obscuribacterales bacterium]|nr:translesion DNA synthesis-associated protein ImuA [Steroidobacteraceae bacterium]
MRPHPSTLTFDQLAQACQLGRVQDLSRPAATPTGIQALDSVLPFGGWPLGAVTEIMPSTEGIGELHVLMPALSALMHAERYVAFVEPPYTPYAPALVQQGIRLDRLVLVHKQTLALSLWATEQMLRCPAFGAVLVWPSAIGDKELRRLQLAAEAGGNLAIVYRPASAALTSSPAALRLCLRIAEQALRIEIKKCRGGYAGKVVECLFDTFTNTTAPAA